MNGTGESAYAMESTPKFENLLRSDRANTKKGFVSISPAIDGKKHHKLRNPRQTKSTLTTLAIDGKQLPSAHRPQPILSISMISELMSVPKDSL